MERRFEVRLDELLDADGYREHVEQESAGH